MPKMKSFKPLPLLAAGFLAASACTLPPPTFKANTSDAGTGATCVSGITGPTSNASSADGGGENNIDNVVTPISCVGTGANPNAIDKYSQGYTQDKGLLTQVESLRSSMSLFDEAQQMRGTRFGGITSAQFNDIQRSQDTVASKIRGFRYRDASRGMDLGEDMDGALPNAATVNNSKVGYSTAFPVSMSRGAAFDLDLEYAVGEAIADEMQAAKQTLLLAPCMNLLRHPLWGRAQETYGEDPFHIGRLASAMTVGVQQHIAANAKHFMAYDIEIKRALNNSEMDEQTLREIYARHFRMVVQDGGVASVMASYNQVNGTKSTQDHHTLTDVLRTDFGFKGFVLSDWWAMPNTSAATDSSTLKATAVQAVKAGLDVELPWGLNYSQLESIVSSNGGLTKADIDTAAARVLEQKLRFNSDKLTGSVGLGSPQTIYKNSRISCDADHIALAQKAAVESMVLLKNDNNTLPIPKSVTKVAVLGATVPYKTTNGGTANTGGILNFGKDVLTGDLGSSRVFPDPDKSIGPLAGIEAAAPSGVTVVNPATAADVPADTDYIVVMAGLTPEDEGEEYTQAGDRLSLALDAKQDPPYQNIQNDLIASAAALGKPMVVVLEGSNVIDMSPWLDQVHAVVMAFYPGQVGGAAIGQLLWGQVNFSGKLPFTWGKQLGDYETFNGGGTTNFNYYVGYRYFDQAGKPAPQYLFGHGLSYTTFEYRKLQLGCSDMSKGAVLPVVVNVANTGTVAGDEIVMVFVSFPNTTARRAAKELKGFTRVHLEAGEEKQITIPVRLKDLDYYDQNLNQWVVEDGKVNIMVGGSSAAPFPLTQTVTVQGYKTNSSNY